MQLTTLRIGAFTPNIHYPGRDVHKSIHCIASKCRVPSRRNRSDRRTGIHPDELREEIRQACWPP